MKSTIAGRLVTKRERESRLCPSSRIEKVKSKSTFVKIGEENYEIFKKSRPRWFLSKVKSAQIWENFLSRQLTSHYVKKHSAHFQRNSTVWQTLKPSIVNVTLTWFQPWKLRTFCYSFKIISEIRRYLDQKGFPWSGNTVLHNEAGGAAARPFITHQMPKYWHGASYRYWVHLKALSLVVWNVSMRLGVSSVTKEWTLP